MHDFGCVAESGVTIMKNQCSTVDDAIPHQILAAIVELHFPSERLVEAYKLSGGFFNTSYQLTLSHSEKVILRIAPDAQYLLPYEHFLMQAEKWAYAICSQNGLPVPSVIAVGEGLMPCKRTYMLTRCIPGMSLHKISIPSEEKKDCYRDAGRFMHRMHSIRGERFGRLAMQLNHGGFDTWGEAIMNEVTEWKQFVIPLQLLPAEIFDAIDTVFSGQLPLLNRITVPHLVHGDLWSGNILANIEDGVCRFKAFIDADHAIFGDPDFDFSGGRMINASFEEGYGKPLDDNEDAFIRRRLYLLLFSMRQCYVYEHLLHDHEQHLQQRKYIEKILREFL